MATLTGKLINIFPQETFGTFTKQTIWLQEQASQYPQTYSIDFSGKSMDALKYVNQGDLVDVEVNIRGRHVSKDGKEYVFNSLGGWKISKAGSNPGPTPEDYKQNKGEALPTKQDGPPPPFNNDDSDDLPF